MRCSGRQRQASSPLWCRWLSAATGMLRIWAWSWLPSAWVDRKCKRHFCPAPHGRRPTPCQRLPRVAAPPSPRRYCGAGARYSRCAQCSSRNPACSGREFYPARWRPGYGTGAARRNGLEIGCMLDHQCSWFRNEMEHINAPSSKQPASLGPGGSVIRKPIGPLIWQQVEQSMESDRSEQTTYLGVSCHTRG
jgi:hypothetical protein